MITALENPRLAQLADDNMEQYELNDSLRLEFNGRYFNVPYREINSTVSFIYRSGYCAFLALAIHEITDLPVAVFTIPGEKEWAGHVAIRVGENSYLDIRGISTAEEIKRCYGFDTDGMSLTIVDNIDNVPQIFHPSIQFSPWAFMNELEELVTRDYAYQLVDEFL